MSQLLQSPRTRTQPERRQVLRRILVALLGALAGLSLVPAVASAQDQVLTWKAGNPVDRYLSAPTTAVAGPATIIFDNSVAAGNTTGMPHTLTFDTSTPGYNHDVDLNILANPYDAQGGYHEAQVTLTPGTYRYFCAIPGHGMMVGEFTVTGDDPDPEDTTAPDVAAAVTGEQDENGAYVGSATVTVTATDEGSGVDAVEYALDGGDWTAYTDPVTVSDPGEHTVDYRATDVAGNTADGSVSFTVVEGDVEPEPDTTPPEVSAEVAGEQDENGAYVGAASVTVTASDADSGVDTVEYALDGGDWTAYTEPVSVSEPGEHTLDYRATDGAGNTADGSVSFTVVAAPVPDTTPPEVSAEVTGEQDENGAYVGTASVTITATDADSGVAMVEYALDGGELTHYHSPVTVSEPGEHTVDFRATDVAGNTADGSVTFTVVEAGPGPDTTPPEVSAEVTGEQDENGAFVGSATVTVTATDADSGVDTVEYALDGGEWTAYTEALTVTEPGEHTVDYRATDVAGNTADGSVTFTVVEEDVEPEPDTTPPEVTAEVTGEQDENGAYVGAATVTVTATDADSGVDTVEYALDGGEWTAYTGPVTVSDPGERTVDYRATDAAGNTADGTVTFTVVEEDVEPEPDTTPPEVTAEVTGEQDENGAYVGSATVTVTATDADSGVDTVEYALDGGEWTAYTEALTVTEPGEHTVDYRATDAAGNTADGTVTFTVVEAEEPEPGECSDPRGTVVIGGIDSGVENVDTADGCLSDLVGADGDYASHGAFVRHVGDVLQPLAADGTITQRELGAVLRAAIRSDIGKQ